MDLAGLWIGFTIAIIILSFGYFWIIKFTNWEQLSKEMKEKNEIEEGQRKFLISSLLSSIPHINENGNEL